jgi:cytochrome c
MAYAGVKRPDQRANLIAYLNQNSDNPLPPPAVDAAAPAPTEGGAAPAADGSAAPAESDVGGAISVPQPQTGVSPEAATPPTGGPEGGAPENPQGGAGSGGEAPVQMPSTGTHQNQQ